MFLVGLFYYCFGFCWMRALRDVRVRFMGREVCCRALFDTGLGVTVIWRVFFEGNFGARWLRFDKPLRLYWINGESITVDKYVQLSIIIDDFELPEVVFIVDDFVREIVVDGRRIKLPELIVGSGTMDKYGIILDPKEGVKLTGAALLL